MQVHVIVAHSTTVSSHLQLLINLVENHFQLCEEVLVDHVLLELLDDVLV